MRKKLLIFFLVLTLTMGLAGQAMASSIGLNINGESITKDVSAQVLLGKAFVPLRYVTEKIGGQYTWNSKERQATVDVDGNTATMKAGEPLVKVNRVPRLVDFPSYMMDGKLMVSLDAVERIFEVKASYDKANSVINLVGKKPEITDLKINRLPGEAQVLITSKKPITGTSKYLAESKQIVLEFPDVASKIGKDKIEVNDELIKEIRIEYSMLHSTTKIVVYLQKAAEHRLEKGPQVNQLLLNVSELGRNSVNDVPPTTDGSVPAPVQAPAKLVDISLNSLPDKDQISFTTNGQAILSPVKKLVNPNRLVLDFNNTRLALPSNSMAVNDEVIKQIRVGQFTNDISRVVIDLNKDAKFKLSPNGEGSSFLLQVAKVPNPDWGIPALEGRVIVIDPGHGGSDPGAIGPTGVREKDVNLSVAQRLYSLLLEAGAQPIMTRNSDIFVDLVPRAQLANDNNADLFVSIHCNSAATYNAVGTETYSYIYANSQEGMKLARAVQGNLARRLGIYDRGPKTANFSVLRNSKMTSILAELAFISNPREEQLLADPSFQQKAAEALLQGIQDYYQQ